MDHDDLGGARQKRRRTSAEGVEGVEEQPQADQRGRGRAAGAQNTIPAEVEEEELSEDDSDLGGGNTIARECALDDRTLDDDMIDEDPGRPPELADDADQAEYVSILTAAPRRASSDGAASTAPSQEPGSDIEIRETFRKFAKDDQFERAAALAHVSDLSLQQVAEREGHILKISTRKSRSAESFHSINRAASLFIAWMKTRADLQEDGDRKADSIFYPSSFKLLKFVDWQEHRASLAFQHANPTEDVSGRGVQCGSIQTSLSNLGMWADHLRFVDPKRFGDGDVSPQLSDLVRMRMDILNQKYAATVTTRGLEFVAGVAAFTTYGRDTRRKMMRSLLAPCRKGPKGCAARLLADTNLRHACIARGEFTRNLTFNNLALLPAELTPRLGPVASKALLVSWRTGKTMKYGRSRSIMCLEDLEVTLCPLFSLALLFFWRFDVLKEAVPDFSDRNKWYRARIFTSGGTGEEYTREMQYARVKRLHKEHGVGGHVVHAARVSAAQEDARNRVPLGETQAVTHMKDINGGALGTTTLVYRPLSALSALSQSGAVRPGETASNATYYNPRQHVDVPESLVNRILPGFMGAQKEVVHGADRGKERLTERGTLELVEYLRYVLLRGAVELHEELPDTWLFKKFPFNSREFLDWAPQARNEIRQLRAADVQSRLHYQASPAIINELERVNGKVDRLTELLERSIANTERLERLLANTSDANGGSGNATSEPSPVPCPSLGGVRGEHAPAISTASAPSHPEGGFSTSHPLGWFHGKLPGFGTCGGKRGSLSQIWEIWGGVGPAKVAGGASGFNLRAHGETTIKEQEVWGSTSNYGRYLQAGRYMDNKIASIKEEKGFSDKDATKEMLFLVAQEKGTDTVTTWFTKYVAGGAKGKKRSSTSSSSADDA